MKKITSTLFMVMLIVKAFASGHTVTISSTNASCNGLCNGTATVIVNGGVGPFEYSWSPSGGTAAMATSLCAGAYTVTVTDSSDMSTATGSVTITQAATPTLTNTTLTQTICSSDIVSIILTSNIPGTTFSWTASASLGITGFTTVGNGNISDMISATGSSGTVTYIITPTGPPPSFCPGTPVSFVVTLAPAITATISTTNITTCGACDGSSSITIAGGNPPYSYQWIPGGNTTPNLTNLCPGNYYVAIIDANSCMTSDTAIIYQSATIHANFTMVPDSTNGLNYYAFNTTTGNNLTYSWDFGDGTNSTLQSPAHLYSSTGTYTVTLTATSTLGCLDSVSHTITVNSTPAACLSLFNIAFDTTSTDPYAYTVYNLSYGSALSYLWSFGDGTSSTLPNPTHVYGGGGPYELCLTVDNGSGCTQMYCDSLMYVDSLSRTINQLSITVVDVNSPLATGIQENRFSYFVNAHPNPFSDNTTFIIQSNKMNETYSFEMTDVLGKKVKSINGITNKQFEISRAGLQNGIYFYKIFSSESVVGIGKLIVK